MSNSNQHWSGYLVTGFPLDQDSEITIRFNAAATPPALVVLLSRLRGLVDALSPTNYPSSEPLDDEHAYDLLQLLDHLNRVVLGLSGQRERVMTALEGRASLRQIASALDVSPETVRRQLLAIERAGQRGMTAAAAAQEDPGE